MECPGWKIRQILCFCREGLKRARLQKALRGKSVEVLRIRRFVNRTAEALSEKPSIEVQGFPAMATLSGAHRI